MYVTFYIPALPAVPEAFLRRMGELPGVFLNEAAKIFGAPENAAWFVEKACQEHGLVYTPKIRNPLPAPFQSLPTPPEALEWVPGFLASYQQDFMIRMGHRPGVRVYHAPGSGKSLTAIYYALLKPGPCAFVTRAGARATIAEEITKYTSASCLLLSGSTSLGISDTARQEAEDVTAQITLPSGHLIPAGTSGGRHGLTRWVTAASLAKTPGRVLWRVTPQGLVWTALEPVERLKTAQGPVWKFQLSKGFQTEALPRFFIVAWESLHSWLPLLVQACPHTAVFDEGHLGSSSKRWASKVVKDDEGGDTTTGLTVQFDRLSNRAAAAETISKMCAWRIETTASPINDRLRNLWAQLDLTEPGAWGKFNPYHPTLAQQTGPYAAFYCNRKSWAERYCDAHSGIFGGIDSRGKADKAVIAELRQRMSYATHLVPYSVTHAQLPPRRIQVTYLGPEDLTKPERIAGATTGDHRTNDIERKLAVACSMKRAWVVAKAAEALSGGSKVVILTARKRDCDETYKALRKVFEKTNPEIAAKIWIAHGELPIEQRDEIRHHYMDAEGAACIIATGGSFGMSLNLQDTDLAIFAMLPYTPGELRQWLGRFSRKGMTRPVLMLFPIAEGTVDEHVAGIMLDKLPAIDQIVGDEELQGIDRVLGGVGSDDEAISGLMKLLETAAREEEEAET